jgi:hypothetical protein
MSGVRHKGIIIANQGVHFYEPEGLKVTPHSITHIGVKIEKPLKSIRNQGLFSFSFGSGGWI